MLVREVMESGPQVISPSSTVCDAAKLMRDGDFGALPVCNGDRLVGMITDRDITTRVVATGRDVNGCSVGEVMTDQILWCYDDVDLAEAEIVMCQNQVRRIPVVNRSKRLVGILSLGDIARQDGAAKDAENVLYEVCQPTHREPNSTLSAH